MKYLKGLFLIAIFAAATAQAESPAEVPLVPGVFKMREINSVGKPNPNCQVYRSLVLDQADMTGSFALTRNELEGFCEIYVYPMETYYHLEYITTDCGSRLFEGKRVSDTGLVKIRVTDHRTRMCRDKPPGFIELTIVTPDGQSASYYSVP
ncbi:MAG: hypothetical protein IPK68_20300 [Bdellovibrionales bacterium]|nr:hypothetical protein [Bdellovibrionales bacterium]